MENKIAWYNFVNLFLRSLVLLAEGKTTSRPAPLSHFISFQFCALLSGFFFLYPPLHFLIPEYQSLGFNKQTSNSELMYLQPHIPSKTKLGVMKEEHDGDRGLQNHKTAKFAFCLKINQHNKLTKSLEIMAMLAHITKQFSALCKNWNRSKFFPPPPHGQEKHFACITYLFPWISTFKLSMFISNYGQFSKAPS